MLAPSITANTCCEVTYPAWIASTVSNATAVLLGAKIESRDPAPKPRTLLRVALRNNCRSRGPNTRSLPRRSRLMP